MANEFNKGRDDNFGRDMNPNEGKGFQRSLSRGNPDNFRHTKGFVNKVLGGYAATGLTMICAFGLVVITAVDLLFDPVKRNFVQRDGSRGRERRK